VTPFAVDELRARLANLVSIKVLRRALSLREQVSEETRRRLIREARDAILVVDNDERVVEANHAAATLCGEDPCGRHLGDIFGLDGDAVEASGGAVVRRGRLRDTADRLVEVSAARLAPGADGLGLVVIRDVTERVTLEEQVNQSRHMAAIGKLTGGIAHDFNNILTVVSGTVDLMDDKVGNHPEMATMVRIIERAAERGAQLTQRMLAFAGRQQLHPVEVSPDEIVSRMAAILKRTIGDDIKVQAIVGDRMWRAFADPAQIEDALLNLAVNARDAMPKGGTLTIEAMNAHLDEAYAQRNDDVAPGDYVALVVTDSGVGMTPEIMARAFEPFFTTKEGGHGTGLGLSMVYGFVRQSGGHVTINSELGRGTIVKLYLPRAKGSVTIAEPVAAAENVAPPRAAGEEAVLVVEDDPAVRSIVRDMLADLGYSVAVAADGPEALAAIDSQRPIDVLFTDLIMPNGMSGYDLYAAARKRRPGLRVIFTSGYSETLLGARDAESRDVPLLGKPYRRQKLAEMMRRVLDRPADM
jgi:signal transduction histidine kinase/CheY-like chemotaxis protein